MGQAKARGSYSQRKDNPLGKKANHGKGFHDLRPTNQVRLLEAKRELAKKRIIETMKGKT